MNPPRDALPIDGRPPAPPDLDARVSAEQVRTLYELAPPPLMFGAAFAVLVALMVGASAGSAMVLAWLGFKLAMTALRVADAIAYRRDPAAESRWRRWWWRYTALMSVDALGWSAMAVLFLPHTGGVVTALVLAGLVGVAAVGVHTTSCHGRTGTSFLLCSLLPTIAWQALQGGHDGRFIAGSLLMYLLVLLYENWRSSSRQLETLRLRWQNAWIAEQREHALLLAEHSSAAKTRFLATVSHEMRTPLNGILGMTQLMRAQVDDPQLVHQLEVMRRSARHLQTVIADLLDLSRIEFDRLDLVREPFAVVDTVREVTDLLAPTAADKGLAFDLRLLPPLPEMVVGDAARIKQVLHNLLGNALKFTEHGSVTLEVGGTTNGLCFTVRDTGEGIPPEQARRIFDAFAQAGTTPTRRAGTGLGLTISRALARAMEGDVTHEPGQPCGAVFRFVVRAPHVTGPADPGATWQPLPFALAGRVLVVDDSPVNALVAQGMLERFGLSVMLAEDGLQALSRQRDRFDAVLMDCQMPGLDGFECTRHWRAQEAANGWGRTPIIAVTANAVAGDRERCLAAGMDDYLAKPFDLNDLGRLLQRHLPASRLADVPAERADA